VSYAQGRLGTDTASLVIALLATLGALIAVGVAYHRHPALPIAATLLVAVVCTVAATHMDLVITQRVRSTLPRHLSWIDRVTAGPVTAIETPLAPKQDLLYQLYWN